jgi:hypothetical protein
MSLLGAFPLSRLPGEPEVMGVKEAVMSFRMISSRIGFPAVSLVLAATLVFGQTETRSGARAMYYSSPVEQTLAVEQPQPAEQSSSRRPSTRSEQPPAVISGGLRANRSRGGIPVSAIQMDPTDSEISSNPGSSGNDAQMQTTTVSYPAPLGLRYSILRRGGGGYVEVDPASIFRSEDTVRLGVDVNTAGSLYIFKRGPGGSWNLLFPSAKIADGDNHVQKGTQYEIPPGYALTFDEQGGTERLFVVFSRWPVLDLDNVIY